MNPVERLEKMLAAGRDDALLRYSLGMAYLNAGDRAAAIEHLARAVQHKPDYTAAWKAYARALADSDRLHEAAAAYRRGLEVARRNGDIQAGKEMRVFLRRVEKRLNEN